MIIGLSGKAGAGKDTLAFALQQIFGFRRAAFADPLKAAAGEIFGLSRDQMTDPEMKGTPDSYWGRTPREILQLLGTEALRGTFGGDIWIMALLRKIQSMPLADWVVTDVRYPNEAVAIRQAGGFVVRIERPGAGLQGEAAKHPSETALDDWELFDAIVHNDQDVERLNDKACELFVQLSGRSPFEAAPQLVFA